MHCAVHLHTISHTLYHGMNVVQFEINSTLFTDHCKVVMYINYSVFSLITLNIASHIYSTLHVIICIKHMNIAQYCMPPYYSIPQLMDWYTYVCGTWLHDSGIVQGNNMEVICFWGSLSFAPVCTVLYVCV